MLKFVGIFSKINRNDNHRTWKGTGQPSTAEFPQWFGCATEVHLEKIQLKKTEVHSPNYNLSEVTCLIVIK